MCQISKIAKSGKSLNPILQFAEVRYGLLRLDGLGMVLNLLFYSELYCINNTTMQIADWALCRGSAKTSLTSGRMHFKHYIVGYFLQRSVPLLAKTTYVKRGQQADLNLLRKRFKLPRKLKMYNVM